MGHAVSELLYSLDNAMLREHKKSCDLIKVKKVWGPKCSVKPFVSQPTKLITRLDNL